MVIVVATEVIWTVVIVLFILLVVAHDIMGRIVVRRVTGRVGLNGQWRRGRVATVIAIVTVIASSRDRWGALAFPIRISRCRSLATGGHLEGSGTSPTSQHLLQKGSLLGNTPFVRSISSLAFVAVGIVLVPRLRIHGISMSACSEKVVECHLVVASEMSVGKLQVDFAVAVAVGLWRQVL